MNYLKFLPALLIFLLLLAPDVSNAQGFVTCNGPDCSACNFVSMGNTILVWLIGVMFVVFGVVAVIAGFGLVTSGGNPGALQDAKSKFVNAFIGLMIVLASWLLVDTVMRGLLGGGGDISGYGVWSQVQCGNQTATNVVIAERSWFGDPVSPNSNGNVVSTTQCDAVPSGNVNCTAASAACPAGTTAVTDNSSANNYYVNCVDLAGASPAAFTGAAAGTCSGSSCVAIGIPCSASGCTISSDMVGNLAAFHAAAGVSGARVTEGYPPSRTHKSQCHYNGTCIDYSKAGGMTSAEVLSTYNAATANGLRPVYEVGTESRRQALISAGVPAGSVKNYGSWISGEHFSIYGY